jgi:cell wall-associated NlpC family hydrolase
LLELRFNHPAAQDALELYPWDPMTRAEASYSFARILRFKGWETQTVRATVARFKLPAYTSTQLTALRLAVSKIGMPYVWAGESDDTTSVYGPQAHGGYDCSGFVWRVFKLSGDPAGALIKGRTAAQIAGEIPKEARLQLPQVAPADILFFGPAKFDANATESGIVHAGIALSPDFMIHSSSQGVAIAPLFDAWRAKWFTWARRIL